MRYFSRRESNALGLNFGFGSKITDETWSRDQVPSYYTEPPLRKQVYK